MIRRRRKPRIQGLFPPASIVAIPRRETLVGRELAGLVQTSRFPFHQQEILPPSDVLKKRSRSGMKLGELWDHMPSRDAFLAGLWMKRWKAVLGLPRYVLPSDETPFAKDVAHFCRLALGEVPGFHTNLVHQLQALTHGWSAEEILWQRRNRGPLAGKWGIDLIDRPMWRFLYKEDGLHIRRAGGDPIPAPPGRFLIMRVGSKDNPWGGLGLLHFTYWYWFAGEHGWKYFAVLIEKWAQPTAVGKYRRSVDTQLDQQNVTRLFEAIEQIQSEYSIVIPDDLMVELLEARRGGEVSYERFIALANLAKALVFLGEADTSGFEQGQGSFARRRVSNEVRIETIRIDAHELDAHLTDNLLRLLVWVNFGAEAPVPLFYTEVEDAEDLRMRQERADALLDHGLPLPLEDFYRLNKQRLPRAGESRIRQPVTDRAVEVFDPPEGFETSPQAAPVSPPLTRQARAALHRHQVGDLHQYRLAA